MLILLDRSTSMNEQPGNTTLETCTDPPTRWNVAVGDIEAVVNAHAADIRFGLATFPAHGTISTDCTVPNPCGGRRQPSCTPACCNAGSPGSGNCTVALGGAVGLDVAVGQQVANGAITTALTADKPGGGTPTEQAFDVIRTNVATFGLNDTSRTNYILLVTDGEPNDPNTCSYSAAWKAAYPGCTSDTAGDVCAVDIELDKLRALAQPIETFVVGFSATLSKDADRNNLNCFAVHGGTSSCAASVTAGNCASQASPTQCYYAAQDGASLIAALNNIAQQIAGGCTLQLQQTPADPQLLFVFVNSVQVPTDPASPGGYYTYDSVRNQVQLVGGVCDSVKAGGAPKIIYGCPGGGS